MNKIIQNSQSIILTLTKLKKQFQKLKLDSEIKVTTFFLDNISDELKLQHKFGFLDTQSGSKEDKSHAKNVSFFTNTKIQEILNHPIHILDSSGKFTPSSFIPFCSFGGNMSVVGKKVDNFPVPVCNKFVKTSLHGQICYSIDINDFKKEIKMTSNTLEEGLNLFLDYNIERQSINNDGGKDNKNLMYHFGRYLHKETTKNIDAQIYFAFLGIISLNFSFFQSNFNSLEPVSIYGGGIYSLNSIKEIEVTDGFKSMTEDQKNCQTSKSYESCMDEHLRPKMRKNNHCIPYDLQNFSGSVEVSF